MRYFPSAARRRTQAACAAAVVALGMLASPFALADDEDKLKDKQREVQGEIESAENHLEHASRELAQATRRMERSQAELSAARNKLTKVRARLASARARSAELKEQLAEAEVELAEADAELKAGRIAVRQQRETVKTDIVNTYTQGPPELRAWNNLLTAGSLEEITLVRLAENLVVNKGNDTFVDLQIAEAMLDRQQERVEAARDKVATKRLQAARTVDRIEGLYAEAAAVRNDVVTLVAENRTARQTASRARARDLRILERLEREEEAIADKLRDLAAQAKGPGFTGESDGFLNYPVNGYITSPYGWRTHPVYGDRRFHDGTDFGKGCGAPMYAGATGTVVEAYYSDGYGHRLFLNVGNVNGQNMTLVYNHASSYRYSIGDRVQRGAVVGAMGTTGLSTGCHLHFQVLLNGATTDPMNYL